MRLTLDAGAASDTYGYVGPTETAFETGSSGTRSLLDLDGSRLAVKNGSTVKWVIFDLHGSVAALCTAGGTTITDAYRYDGWGQTIATYPSSGATANPWKYRGLLGIDPSAGADKLYDMGARDYAPSTGTFTQLDSVQGGAVNPMTMNRFLYALANPATLIDPDGHAAETTTGGSGCSTEHSCATAQQRDEIKRTRAQRSHQAVDAGIETHRFNIDPAVWEAAKKAKAGIRHDPIGSLGDSLYQKIPEGLARTACDFTVCLAAQALFAPADLVAGTVDVWGTAINSLVSGRGDDDLVAGWNAMLAMDPDARMHFWGNVALGGFLPAKGLSSVRAARPSPGIILDYSDFPVPGLTPTGALRLVSGDEYAAARAAANAANKSVRADARNAGFDPTGYQVHEIQPVKWGGSATDLANKVLIPNPMHVDISVWWQSKLRAMGGI